MYSPGCECRACANTQFGVGSFEPLKIRYYWRKLAVNDNFFCKVEEKIKELVPNLKEPRNVAIAVDGEKIGVAVMHPRDAFDKREGRSIADSRLD